MSLEFIMLEAEKKIFSNKGKMIDMEIVEVIPHKDN